MNDLEKQWQNLQQQAKKMSELDKECQELGRQIPDLPSLQKRKATLESALKTFQNEERTLATKEAQHAALISQLKERNAWADMATLHYNIRLKQQELEQLSKQVDAKRSLLDRILHRNQPGEGK